MSDIRWQKSSFSTDSVDCIELAHPGIHILLRESDEPGVAVRTTPERLRPLLLGVKAGTLDHPM
ncbi:DUF397 domain-containing protein [Streptomyces sp. AV19]|uniref:DUF397 domain-containing protein n=1 Tax=Streptomyces sp. AV19 TaxID=2793068 RepID=UPI0018FEF1FB|nr:DUF397 domain-containing protein [Streptomyces sp. AV19]MBH1936143.1 DUF397 domain-containing protein [Streptomyces sp. AV19]MDG4534061.1 DUF397 domain-containing protein [Streptomyces sp. AV19]